MNWYVVCETSPFSMLVKFFLLYGVSGLFLRLWVEGSFYLLRLFYLRFSVDFYSVSFYYLLGIVSGSVGVWSYYYLRHEEAYRRFILLLIRFLIRMVLLIFFSNIYMTLIGWDCLGLTSFLLVIYYKNRKSLGSGFITSLTNRLGDCFLICILGFLFNRDSHAVVLLLLIIIRITKRAQFPFSSWLPAAIAAPTPVRALVHSSTLVTAGVYVLIRYCFLDSSVLLFVGCITIIMAGLRACAERDIKKVVALSTLSQLGVIIVSLGAEEKRYCFFHLTTHACFKALLFICIGFRIHTVFGTQDYRRFNRLNTTSANSLLCAVANLSLFGFVFSTGFYSKDKILEVLYCAEGRSWFLLLFLLGVGLTAAYSIKILKTLVLWGTYTATNTRNLRGLSWESKWPLYLLGVFRICYGSTIDCFCRPFLLTSRILEKFLPISILIIGLTSGIFFHRLKAPTLTRLILLTPTTQSLREQTIYIQQQIHVDKGWIEAFSVRVTAWSTSLLYQYRTVVGVGLSSLLLICIII